MNAAGNAIWRGGFEPFGADFTVPSAQTSGIFLRLPGQWWDGLFDASTLGAQQYQNLYRWYSPSGGSYARVDPLRVRAARQPYLYAYQRPAELVDRTGLQPALGTATPEGGCCPSNQDCCASALAQGMFPPGAGGITVCCDGKKIPCALARTGLPPTAAMIQSVLVKCVVRHEESHVLDLPDCPPNCGVRPAEFANSTLRGQSECFAADAEIACLQSSASACGGDAACLQVIQARIEDLEGSFKQQFGCGW